MKKLVFAVLAMLVLAGNAYSQALSPYERKYLELASEFLKKTGNPELTKLANTPNNRDKLKEVKEYNYISFSLFSHRLRKILHSVSSLEKSEKYFSQITPKKGEFESTNEYNERLNAFYDRTAYYLEEYALKETESILEILVKNSKFILDSYNADKGIYAVEAIIEGGCSNYIDDRVRFLRCYDNITIVGDTVKSTISISPQEAQLLKTGGSTFNINPTDIYLKDYLVYPSKITVTSKADTTKKYVVNFPKPTGASDIVFRGSELWANNPKAKNLVYNYKDLAAELSAKQEQQRAEQERIAEEKRAQEEQERIAEEKRAEKERAEEQREQEQKNKEEWAKRVAKSYSALILKLPSGDIRFEEWKPFPSEVIDKEFNVQGKTVSFKSKEVNAQGKGKGKTVSIKSVSVKIADIPVFHIQLDKDQNMITTFGFNAEIINDRYVKTFVVDYLGYGVFDVE